MITIKNVEYFFDSRKVLDGVDLTILQGEFVFLIGATGVGKSRCYPWNDKIVLWHRGFERSGGRSEAGVG